MSSSFGKKLKKEKKSKRKNSNTSHSSESKGDEPQVRSGQTSSSVPSSPRTLTDRSRSSSITFGSQRATSFRYARPTILSDRNDSGNPFEAESESDGSEKFVPVTRESSKKEFTLRNTALTLLSRFSAMEERLESISLREQQVIQLLNKVHGHNRRFADTVVGMSEGRKYQYDVQYGNFIELDDHTREPELYEPAGCLGCCFGY